MKIENFEASPKKVKEQYLSSWVACPKYLCTQVHTVNVITWKPCVIPATALPFAFKLQDSGSSL